MKPISLGTSVFVLGRLPELGRNTPLFAVKMEPIDYPEWRLSVALPAGRSFACRYATRHDEVENLADPGTIQFISGSLEGEICPAAAPPSENTGADLPGNYWRPVSIIVR
ncbi:hypothetical protein JW905_12040 [bacterium]|nr:hypothetical protein [candidate division CSSED10-310 bacterium]